MDTQGDYAASGRPAGPAGVARTVSDADLLDGCRRGDSAAWDELVARYERLVFTVARRNGLDREDAADVTQTVYVALLESLPRIQAGERLAYWLMTVARRHSWRLRSRHDRETTTDTVVFDRADGHDGIAAWERTTVLVDAVYRLRPPCRDLLLALYFDSASPSYADIADRLGRSIGTIGPMRARCLEHLRSLLPEDAL